MSDMCTDNRFEQIEKYKKMLIEATNIETSSEEMQVIDSILFRFWQMGWLEAIDRMLLVKESARTLMHIAGDSVSAKAFRNAGRFIQNAIDGEPQEFEKIPSSSNNCSEDPNKWIQCECAPNTMPKDGQIVLITQQYSGQEFEDGNDVTIAQYKNKHFTWYHYQKDWDKHTSIVNHGDICPGNEYVTAWMPLPNPYQPKAKGGINEKRN